jgi:hypothetical protein
MRVMMKVSIPVETGNKGVREGLLAKTVQDFVERTKPEACYFGPEAGKRTAWFIFDLADVTQMPPAAEPFFMALNASVDLTPILNLEDLKVGIDKASKLR